MTISKIETKEQLIEWAKEANLCCNTKQTVALQDIFARSSIQTISDIYNGNMGSDRRLVTFSIYKIMGDDMVIKYLMEYAKQRAMAIVRDAEIDLWKRLDEKEAGLAEQNKQLHKEKEVFAECKGSINRKIGKLYREIESLKRENAVLRNEAHHLRQSLNQTSIAFANTSRDASKFREIRNLLNE